MSDLRAAAQQALEALETLMLERGSIYETAITALREALAREHAMHELARLGQEIEQPEQEPLATLFGTLPVYDAPPAAQRPWQGLTEKDWEYVKDSKGTSLDTFDHGAAWAADQLMERNT